MKAKPRFVFWSGSWTEILPINDVSLFWSADRVSWGDSQSCQRTLHAPLQEGGLPCRFRHTIKLSVQPYGIIRPRYGKSRPWMLLTCLLSNSSIISKETAKIYGHFLLHLFQNYVCTGWFPDPLSLFLRPLAPIDRIQSGPKIAVLGIRIRRIRTYVFWASWIRILLSPCKTSKKNLDSYCFVTSFWLFIL